MITNYGLEQFAIRLGSDIPAPLYGAIGIGSGLVATTNITLGSEAERNYISALDVSVAKRIAFETDFSTIEMSGLALSEFGMFNQSGINVGSCFTREQLNLPISFDGTNELKIVVNVDVY